MNAPITRPLIGLTMGDVAGIGPEVIARGWPDPRLHAVARPLVIGDPRVLRLALALVDRQTRIQIQDITAPEESSPSESVIPCLAVSGNYGDVLQVAAGTVDPRAGRAAFEFLAAAADLALEGRIDAITTLPLNKQALHQSGVSHPGHTEILAARCGVTD